MAIKRRCADLDVRDPRRTFAKGEIVPIHSHPFPHMTVLWGRWMVRVHAAPSFSPQGDILAYGAAVREVEVRDGYVEIPAGTWHSFTCLEDEGRHICVFPPRNHSGETVEQYTGWPIGSETGPHWAEHPANRALRG